jgi:recombination protein RecA
MRGSRAASAVGATAVVDRPQDSASGGVADGAEAADGGVGLRGSTVGDSVSSASSVDSGTTVATATGTRDNARIAAGVRPAPKRMEKQHVAKTKDEKAEAGKVQALDRAMGQIEKTFGKGAIMRFDDSNRRVINGISTGALSLDLALGGLGVPRGRVVEIYGPESSGKTTLALSVVASAQKEGGVAAFIDAEHALDPSWARRIGVDVDQLLVSQPDTGEQGLEICEMLVRSNAVDVIVIDSVAALIPRAEIEGEMGDTHVGLQARLMSQALRKLTGAISKSDCTVIFINQLREKIGVMFGSPETTPGGRALKFYSSVRIDVRRTGAIKDGDANVGNHVRARVVKNKIAPPFRDAEFDIMFAEGISVTGDLLDLAVKDDIIAKAGAWFSYGETRLGQGRENVKVFLKENPDLFDEIRKKVLVARGVLDPSGKAPVIEESPAVDEAMNEEPVAAGA